MRMKDVRLENISLVVRDAGMMVRFYREVLGMDLLQSLTGLLGKHFTGLRLL